MFRRDPKTGRKVAIGSALAAGVGYLAGILTAPKSGKETRADLASKAEDVKFDAQSQLKTAEVELTKAIKEAQTKTVALSAKAKEELNEALIRAKDVQNKTRTIVKGLKEGQSESPELDRALRQARQAKKNLGKYLKA